MAFLAKKNNARSLVTDNPLTAGALTVNVTAATGAIFPAAGDFMLTIWDAVTYPDPSDDSNMEVVRATARSTDAITITRAQEGTTGVAHAQGSKIAMLITAGTLNEQINQNVKTTDSPTFATLTVTGIAIGANTLTTAEWANLDGINQTVATTSSPTFAGLSLGTGGLNTVGTITPAADSTYNLGTSAPLYFANAYIDTLLLNSTATWGGGTAGVLTGTGALTCTLDLGLVATKKIYLDGVARTGNTYLYESSADVMDFYAGGVNALKLSATAVTVIGTLQNATGAYYYAGGTDIAATDMVAATTSAQGAIEIAIASEVNTGTDATRAVSPDALSGSVYGKRVIQLKIMDEATLLTTGDGKLIFCVPSELTGYNLVDADAFVTTVATGATKINVDIRNVTDSTDMLSTNITIDASEFTSYTAATQPVINTTYDDVATGDLISVDVDAIGNTTPGKGLGVILTFQLP